MSYLIPSWDLPIEKREKFRILTTEAMIQHALNMGITQYRSELCIRKLMYKDIGLRGWRTPPQMPNEIKRWVGVQVPSGCIFSIYKVTQVSLNPRVSTLSIRRGYSGAITLAVHELDELYGILPLLKKLREYKKDGLKQTIYGIDNLKMEGFFSEPIILAEKEYVCIDVCSPDGNKKGDRLVISGFVAERYGEQYLSIPKNT